MGTTQGSGGDWREGFILHRRPWRETSLWLEVFTPDLGKVALLAKGGRRSKRGGNGLLQPFQPLLMRWREKSDLGNLIAAEALDHRLHLAGPALYCGFYLNELLSRLLERHDPHPGLYREYCQSLSALSRGEELENCLRCFEVRLFAEIGYGLILDHEVEYGTAVVPTACYRYHPERGPIRDDRGWLHGQTLLALSQGRLETPVAQREAKRLLRGLIDHRLEGRALKSRALFRKRMGKHEP
ncbi:DNA repair protein RecO [Methylohalobius crimeensis]|uniref:DNA repair protein RecO n=1 Tax=Methylohalobius crimeensis TaxID=244365 RepID=UPI0003B59CAB|nr:DNA repair protein RecO [Methylohalobius crimeensis]